MTESIIARTRVEESQGAFVGTLVLTTERVVVIGLDGRTVHWEARREDISRANQSLRVLTLFRRDEVPGLVLELGSVLAGPVRWDWYFAAPRLGFTTSDRFWGRPDDPLVGPVTTDTHREALESWLAMTSFNTVGPFDHYLDDLPPAPVRWEDIVEVVYTATGKGDGPSWLLVVRLADGRWVYYQHVLQITGEVYTTTVVARSLETLWWGAMTEDERDRLTSQMSRERLDEELVRLDAVLESPEPNLHRHAEARMQQIRRLRSL